MNSHAHLKIGDLIKRPKYLGLTNHVGVVVGHDQVLHNTPERGEHVSTIREFARGLPVEVVATGANPADIFANASAILADPKKYDLFQRNCEHTASETVYRRSISPQLTSAFVVMGICALVVVASRR